MSGVDISSKRIEGVEDLEWTAIPDLSDEIAPGGGDTFLLSIIKELEGRIGDLEAKLATARADALKEAIEAVSQVSSTIQGTPYTAGPRKFCDAIRALIEKETK